MLKDFGRNRRKCAQNYEYVCDWESVMGSNCKILSNKVTNICFSYMQIRRVCSPLLRLRHSTCAHGRAGSNRNKAKLLNIFYSMQIVTLFDKKMNVLSLVEEENHVVIKLFVLLNFNTKFRRWFIAMTTSFERLIGLEILLLTTYSTSALCHVAKN